MLIGLLNNFKLAAQSNTISVAALQLENQIFNSKNNDAKINLIVKKAELLKSTKDFSLAIQNLNRIDLENLEDTLQQKILYQLMLCNYLNEDFISAKTSMIQYDNYCKDTSDKYGCNWLKCLIFLYNDDFENAQKKLLQSVNDTFKNTADSIFSASLPKLKNEKKAKILSAILPGTGQMYAGKIGFGMVNLLAVTGATYFTYWHILHQYYLIAAVTGTGLFGRFYLGGLKTSQSWVQRKNNAKTNQFKLKMANLLLMNLATH
jgi:hypothetical protein